MTTLFTATDVARLCGVDPKTIHHWIDRGKLACFRTGGRHVRVRRLVLADFMRAHGYDLPRVVYEARPRVVVIGAEQVPAAIAKRFETWAFLDVVDALVAVGAHEPDAVVIQAPTPPLEVAHVIARLRANEATRHTRVVTDDGAGGTKLRAELEELTLAVPTAPRGTPSRR